MNTQLVPEKCFVHSAIAQKMPFKNRTCSAIWLSSEHFKNLPLKTVDCGAWNENGAYERQRPNKPAKMNTKESNLKFLKPLSADVHGEC